MLVQKIAYQIGAQILELLEAVINACLSDKKLIRKYAHEDRIPRSSREKNRTSDSQEVNF